MLGLVAAGCSASPIELTGETRQGVEPLGGISRVEDNTSPLPDRIGSLSS